MGAIPFKPTRPDTYWNKYTSKPVREVTTIEVFAKPFNLDGKTYPHGHLSMTLRRAMELPIEDYIDAARTNALGYSDPSVGECKARELRELRNLGYTYVYDLGGTWKQGYVGLTWQEYDPSTYCGGPRLDLCSTNLDDTEHGCAIVRTLATLVSPDYVRGGGRLDSALANPTKVYATLVDQGAILLRRVKVPSTGYSWDLFVKDDRPRLRFLTDDA